MCALRLKTLEQLKVIYEKASVPAQNTTAEDLRIALYAMLQEQTSGSFSDGNATEVEPWPGPGEPRECEEFASRMAAGKQEREETQAQEAAKRGMPPTFDLTPTFDSDGDHKLSRAELQGVIDSRNQAALAKNCQECILEYNLFDKLDTNGDGFIDKAEAEAELTAFQKSQMALWQHEATEQPCFDCEEIDPAEREAAFQGLVSAGGVVTGLEVR